MRGEDIRDFMQPHYILLCVRAYIEEAPGKCNCTVFYGPRLHSRGSRTVRESGFSVLFRERANERNRYIPFEILAVKSDDCVQGDRSPSRGEISRRPIRPCVLEEERRNSRERVSNSALESRWILNAASIILKSTNYRGVYLSPRIPVTCREVVPSTEQKRLRKRNDISIL